MSHTPRSRFSPQKRVSELVEGESLTQQNFRNDSDINNIVGRHLRGVGRTLANIGAGGTRQPIFGDFSSIDYQSMLNAVTDIQNHFDRLPGRIRNRFRNDPYQLIRWVEDPANLKDAVKMGLVALPQGMVVTEEGQIVEQTDLTKEPAKGSEKPPENQGAVKADPEGQPNYNPPSKKGGEK